MKELFKRIFAQPAIAAELITGSFFINVLALASSLFVMQVLNRYVSHGVDSTLFTLTMGVTIAILMEFLFRQVRAALARNINVTPDEKAAITGFTILTRAKAAALDRVPAETRREMVNGMSAVENAYSANNITTVLDVPFSAIFVIALYLLSPIIAGIVLFFLVGVFAMGVYGSLSMQAKTAELQKTSGVGSALLSTATREQELVRSFNAGDYLRKSWTQYTQFSQGLRRDVSSRQGLIQTIGQSANSIMSVCVITVGALLVVAGEINTGAMIGANILASRALQPISKLSQLGSSFAKARQALALFAEMAKLPLEPEKGSAVSNYSGTIEFRDLAFTYPGQNTPVFESFNLKLEPGSVLLVVGNNGAGKTTLARLIMGLIEPSRGQVLADGLDMKQVSLEWWRRQVIYMPQEPSLLNGTIVENLRINNPDVELGDLNHIIDATGLRRFLDESPQSFDTPVVDNGWRLAEGIRRRLGLARALATNGKLAVIDEPTESLDAEGCQAVHNIMGNLVKTGRTIIVMTHDRNIVRGPHILLDLDSKPVPTIRDMAGTAGQKGPTPPARDPARHPESYPAMKPAANATGAAPAARPAAEKPAPAPAPTAKPAAEPAPAPQAATGDDFSDTVTALPNPLITRARRRS